MKLSERLRDVGTRITVAFALESEEAVKEFIRSYMVARVERVSPGQLAYAIENRTDLWSRIPANWIAFGRNFVKDPRVKGMVKEYSNVIDDRLVMQWLQADRPDLFSILINWSDSRARGWLHEQTEKVKEGILKGEPILLVRAPPEPQDEGPLPPRTTQEPPA